MNKQVRVIAVDGRHLVGKLLAFDKYMNLVLADTQEQSTTRAGSSQERRLGLIVVRGEQVTSAIAEKSAGAIADRLAAPPIAMQL